MQGLVLAKTLGEAGKRYYLATGEYPTSFDVLDTGIHWEGNATGLGTYAVADVKSTTSWSCQLVANVGLPQYAVVLTRLSGPHKGAGLMYYWSEPGLPTHEVLCYERFQGEGIHYTGHAGDFCQKIFNATYVGGVWNRYYSLP